VTNSVAGFAVLLWVSSSLAVDYNCSQQDMTAAGLNCTEEEPCQVYLELSAAESAGDAVFLAGNLHTNSVTLYSILLSSRDAGKTWSEPIERLRGAALDRIQFFDQATGWISGEIVQPLPRDPFLLVTTDGGATWRRRPVFSESRPGAIERFLFDSRTAGTLWIDRGQSSARYERYESATGGESWNLRDASNRPPPPERETGWRLRVDARTESYRLERSRDGQWQPVATFLIPIAKCGIDYYERSTSGARE